jgi:hypothetical protein
MEQKHLPTSQPPILAYHSARLESQAQFPIAYKISVTVAIVAASWVIFLAWFMPVHRREYLGIFHDFHFELPTITKVMIAIPDEWFVNAATVLLSLIFGVQITAQSKRNATIFHLMIMVLCALIFFAFHEAFSHPMNLLIQAITGPPGGIK